jgi:hypothetical protein
MRYASDKQISWAALYDVGSLISALRLIWLLVGLGVGVVTSCTGSDDDGGAAAGAGGNLAKGGAGHSGSAGPGGAATAGAAGNGEPPELGSDGCPLNPFAAQEWPCEPDGKYCTTEDLNDICSPAETITCIDGEWAEFTSEDPVIDCGEAGAWSGGSGGSSPNSGGAPVVVGGNAGAGGN